MSVLDSGYEVARRRRARLVARHHLAATATAAEQVADALVALHATDPATPFLSVFARIAPDHRQLSANADNGSVVNVVIADTERALYRDRSLWRRHAMRRTLFVVPAAHGALIHAAAGADVAASERAKLVSWVTDQYGQRRAARMIGEGEQTIIDALGHSEWSTRQLADAHPELRQPVTVGSGKWRSQSTLGSRLLLVLAAEGQIVRTRPAGSWRSSQYRWMRTSSWFVDASLPTEAVAGDRMPADAWLLERYLGRFGPASFEDLRWWTGWTATKTRNALEHVASIEVELPDGTLGLDVAVTDADAAADETTLKHLDHTVTLLPALDPTPMGWKRREWYLPGDPDELFDRNGNIGPTVWAAGKIVGGWAHTSEGTVVFELLEQVTADQHDGIVAAAQALETALDGNVVVPRFRTPLERRLAARKATS